MKFGYNHDTDIAFMPGEYTSTGTRAVAPADGKVMGPIVARVRAATIHLKASSVH